MSERPEEAGFEEKGAAYEMAHAMAPYYDDVKARGGSMSVPELVANAEQRGIDAGMTKANYLARTGASGHLIEQAADAENDDGGATGQGGDSLDARLEDLKSGARDGLEPVAAEALLHDAQAGLKAERLRSGLGFAFDALVRHDADADPDVRFLDVAERAVRQDDGTETVETVRTAYLFDRRPNAEAFVYSGDPRMLQSYAPVGDKIIIAREISPAGDRQQPTYEYEEVALPAGEKSGTVFTSKPDGGYSLVSDELAQAGETAQAQLKARHEKLAEIDDGLGKSMPVPKSLLKRLLAVEDDFLSHEYGLDDKQLEEFLNGSTEQTVQARVASGSFIPDNLARDVRQAWRRFHANLPQS